MAEARIAFHQDLDGLQDDLVLLGSMVDKAIYRSMDALVKNDIALAEAVIKDDELINARRFDIEEHALRLVALQAPMASDLRIIAAVFSIIADLERMGDHAEGIAKIVLLHDGVSPLQPLTDLELMAEKARAMLRDSLQAYTNRDAEQARRVCAVDDEIDALYDRFYHGMLQRMIDDTSLIQRATYLIWASHNLERIGDRSTNICERVVFLATGRMEEMNISKY